ncbi:RND family transporter [Patescibacteria group bacterium]
MMKKLYNFVSKNPKKVLIAAAVLTVFFIAFLSRASVQSNLHDFLDDKYIGGYDYIKENFEERDLLSITIEAQNDQDILAIPLLHEQDNFFNEVENKWPVEVDSLTTTLNKHIGKKKKPDGSPFSIQNIFDRYIVNDFIVSLYQEDPYEFERLVRKGLSNKNTIDQLQELNIFSHYTGGIPQGMKFDFPKASSIRATITTKDNVSRDQRREMYLGIRDLATDYSENLNIRLYAMELLEKDMDQRVLENSPFVIGFIILLLAIVLYITFRSVFFTVVPLVILGLMIVWSFGMSSALGVTRFSFLHIVAIPLLLGQCIDNLIHFNERFKEEYGKHSKRQALKIVFTTAGKAAGYTTFLNMVAFSADMVVTPLKPVSEYALIIVLGLGIALVLSYILGGAILLKTKLKMAPQNAETAEKGSEHAKKLFDFINKRKLAVLAVSFTLFGAMLFSVTRMDLNFRTSSYMPKNFPTHEAYEFEKDNFSLYLPHYVLLKGDIATNVALEAVTKIEETLNEIEDVEHIHNKANTESINYVLAKFKEQYFPESLGELYSEIKKSDIIINPVALLTAKEVAQKIIQEEDGKFPATVIKFWPAETDSFRMKAIAEKIDEAALEFKDEFNIEASGTFLAYSKTQDDIIISSTLAAWITLFIIIILLWIVYKKLKTSLITVMPIFFGAVFGLGMLPILGIELNALNGTIAVLALGLGIDYAIQIMTRYQEELDKNETPVHAMRECFAHMVAPLCKCVLLTTAGLFVLIGLLPITGKYGIAAAVSLLTGYLAAVFVMPIFAVKFIKKSPGK